MRVSDFGWLDRKAQSSRGRVKNFHVQSYKFLCMISPKRLREPMAFLHSYSLETSVSGFFGGESHRSFPINIICSRIIPPTICWLGLGFQESPSHCVRPLTPLPQEHPIVRDHDHDSCAVGGGRAPLHTLLEFVTPAKLSSGPTEVIR